MQCPKCKNGSKCHYLEKSQGKKKDLSGKGKINYIRKDFRARGESCKWESHLNWLAIFCDTNNIEVRSKGRVKQCMAEDENIKAGGVSVEQMGAFCFSFDDSNWSNNVAMFGREWWITAIGHGAILTEGDGKAVLQAIADKIGNVNVPAATIASAVRTELTTELARIDTSISSRSTLTEIEGSSVIAKEATVATLPTLSEIESSTVLAKDETVAKETTVNTVKSNTNLIPGLF
jgi:hypothetical protein